MAKNIATTVKKESSVSRPGVHAKSKTSKIKNQKIIKTLQRTRIITPHIKKTK
jgi:ribosomal protein S19